MDPPAALTHMPLRRRPIPAVNIHEHLHDGYQATWRHVNVSVERTGYEPARLDRVLARAVRRCAAGRRESPLPPNVLLTSRGAAGYRSFRWREDRTTFEARSTW